MAQTIAARPHPGRGGYTFKKATEDWELEQISQLNYETFVEELPQHEQHPSRRLIDQFHEDNTYFICLRAGELVGMVAVRDQRPFSLDRKLGNLDDLLPENKSPCEIRLLSIRKERRNGRILHGLLSHVAKYCVDGGYDLALISGSTQRLKLYESLGFKPFGPIVGTPEASFQPMYRRMSNLRNEFAGRLHPSAAEQPRAVLNFLPGPVAIRPAVQEAFAQPPMSHRAPEFVESVARIKAQLCELAGTEGVELLLGSGTLANDAIVAQLSLLQGPGLILSNGEFGERLVDHAQRMGLDFDTLKFEWGQPISKNAVGEAISRREYAWLWAVHCETSTGVLNDIDWLKELCAARRIKLALDCISSIGTTPLDLRGVYFASAASGKGLGSFPGLSMVFYNHRPVSSTAGIPRYLDLGFLAAKGGVPFTTSSNLVLALGKAIEDFVPAARFAHIAVLDSHLRRGLRDLEFELLVEDSIHAPAVTTITLPQHVSSLNFGRALEEEGFLLSYNSEYLVERNWIQVCLMGDISLADIDSLLGALGHVYSPAQH